MTKLLPRNPKITIKTEIDTIFKIFDNDKDGFVNGEDLSITFKKLKLITNEEEVQKMLFCTGHEGRLNYNDFSAFYSKIMNYNNETKIQEVNELNEIKENEKIIDDELNNFKQNEKINSKNNIGFEPESIDIPPPPIEDSFNIPPPPQENNSLDIPPPPFDDNTYDIPPPPQEIFEIPPPPTMMKDEKKEKTLTPMMSFKTEMKNKKLNKMVEIEKIDEKPKSNLYDAIMTKEDDGEEELKPESDEDW
jgi:hypothetical protein